jgi:hypothetical protein
MNLSNSFFLCYQHLPFDYTVQDWYGVTGYCRCNLYSDMTMVMPIRLNHVELHLNFRAYVVSIGFIILKIK